jgi:hypothetical protein
MDGNDILVLGLGVTPPDEGVKQLTIKILALALALREDRQLCRLI